MSVLAKNRDLPELPPERPADMVGVQISGDHERGCGVCREGLVMVVHQKTGEQAECYACICERGKAKQQAYPKLASIAQLLPDDELRGYWPKGAPEATRDRVLQILNKARIPPKFLPWSLASYSERFKSEKAQRQYLKLASEWLKLGTSDRSDLIIYGPNGTGKTGMAIALARALAEQHQQSVFWTMRELSIAWRDTYREQAGEAQTSEQDFLASLVTPELLIVDEVSGLRFSEFVEDTLTMIVDQRQKQQRPTILTLNLPAEQGLPIEEGEIITQLLGPTLQDRLRERGQWWLMKGLSRRNTYGQKQETAP